MERLEGNDAGAAARRRWSERGLVVGVGLAALAVYLSYARYGGLLQDEGWLLDGATRVARGQVPHRDFASIYPPGRYWLAALALEAFGDNPLSVRQGWALLRAVVVAATYAVGRRFLPRRSALVAAAVVLLAPGPWHKTPVALVPMVGLLPLLAWTERGGRGHLALAGAAAGLGVLLRQDVGLALLGVGIVLPAALAVGARGGRAGDGPYAGRAGRALVRRAAGDAAGFAAGAGVVLGVAAAAAASAGALRPALEQVFLRAASDGAPRASILAELARFELEGLGHVSGRVVALLAWLPLVAGLGGVVAGARGLHRGRDVPRAAALLALGALTLATAPQVWRADVLVRFLQVGPGTYLLLLAGAEALARRARRPELALAAHALAALFVAFVLLARDNRRLPVEYTGSAAVCLAPSEPLRAAGGRLLAPRGAAHLDALVDYVRAHTAEHEPIFVVEAPSSLYFLAGRPNPTHRPRAALSQLSEDELARVGHELRASGCRLFVAPERRVARFRALLRTRAQRDALPRATFGPWVVLEVG